MRRFQELSDEARMQLVIMVLRDSGKSAFRQSQVVEALAQGYFVSDTIERAGEDETTNDTGVQELYEHACSILDVFCTVVYIERGTHTADVASLDGELSTLTLDQLDDLAEQLDGTRSDANNARPAWKFNDYAVGRVFAQRLSQLR